MAESSGNTDLFDCQVRACKNFFQASLPKVQNLKPLENDDIPENAKRFKGPINDITKFNAREVVALLSRIANDREKFTAGKTFYLLLRNGQGNEPEELFRLTASPTTHQPGNAIVFLRPRGNRFFKREAKKYDELNGALKAHYEKDTASFSRDIMKLFENAVANNDLPQATFEVYMILLFEIARRLVVLKEPSALKEQFDILPIGSAVARIVRLLELGSETICTFDLVFLPGDKFHCFTGKVDYRRKAIDCINETTTEIAKKKWLESQQRLPSIIDAGAVMLNRATMLAMQFRNSLEELTQMFAPKNNKRPC